MEMAFAQSDKGLLTDGISRVWAQGKGRDHKITQNVRETRRHLSYFYSNPFMSANHVCSRSTLILWRKDLLFPSRTQFVKSHHIRIASLKGIKLLIHDIWGTFKLYPNHSTNRVTRNHHDIYKLSHRMANRDLFDHSPNCIFSFIFQT